MYIGLAVVCIVVICIFVYTFVLSSLCLPVRCLAFLWQQPCGETSFMFVLCFSFYKVVVCCYRPLLLLLLLLINYSQHFAVVVTDLLPLPRRSLSCHSRCCLFLQMVILLQCKRVCVGMCIVRALLMLLSLQLFAPAFRVVASINV